VVVPDSICRFVMGKILLAVANVQNVAVVMLAQTRENPVTRWLAFNPIAHGVGLYWLVCPIQSHLGYARLNMRSATKTVH
jgi:hypothetical protein